MGPGDPYYQYNAVENSMRNDYYGQPARPHLFVDGTDAGTIPEPWEMYIVGRLGIESNLEVEISGSYNETSREVTLLLTVTATGAVPQPNLRLHVALTESGLGYAGETHNQVMRDMIPDAQGESFTISEGETRYFDRDFIIDNQLEDQNCEIVVFVQSQSTRGVLQSAKVALTDLPRTGVEEDVKTLPGTFVLEQNHPNPFNASTVIAFNLPKPAAVELQIFNLSGQLVRALAAGKIAAGVSHFTWDGLDDDRKEVSSGIYFYRLDAGEWSQTKKLSLVR